MNLYEEWLAQLANRDQVMASLAAMAALLILGVAVLPDKYKTVGGGVCLFVIYLAALIGLLN